MAETHTPGPTADRWEWAEAESPMAGAVTELWLVNAADDTDRDLVMWPRISTAEGVMYLELEFGQTGAKELIAAAPALLEACEALCASIKDACEYTEPQHDCWWELSWDISEPILVAAHNARAAIAKAKG